MTAAVLTRPAPSPVRSVVVPAPRRPIDDASRITPVVGHQRVLHRVVRREFRMLAEVTTWAAGDDVARAAELTRHADLIARVLLQHHATERAVSGLKRLAVFSPS
jgi:hypothetical protein